MTRRSGPKQASGSDGDFDAPLFGAVSDPRPGSVAGPSPIDVHVGNRIRLRRTLAGLSQEKLGDALGLTFQQVQKYERGANRVSASRLFDIGRVLDVPVNYFYDDMPATQGGGGSRSFGLPGGGPMQGGFAEAQEGFGSSNTPDDVFSRKETIDLVRAYYRIAEPTKRRKVLDLIKSMGPD